MRGSRLVHDDDVAAYVDGFVFLNGFQRYCFLHVSQVGVLILADEHIRGL